jgi:hypothetical protein
MCKIMAFARTDAMSQREVGAEFDRALGASSGLQLGWFGSSLVAALFALFSLVLEVID